MTAGTFLLKEASIYIESDEAAGWGLGFPVFLFFFMSFVTNILLLNALIAIMSDTYDRVVLQVRDILLELDGVPIANDGTIQLPGTHDLVRVTFSYLVYRAARDQPLKMVVLRNHERLEFVVPARPQPELLLVCKQPLPKPSYLAVGGLIFVPLMSPCAAARPRRDRGSPSVSARSAYDSGHFSHRYEQLIPRRKLDDVLKQPAYEGQQIVLLLMVLRAEVNVGYEDLLGQVATLNGEPIRSLRGLKEQVESISPDLPPDGPPLISR